MKLFVFISALFIVFAFKSPAEKITVPAVLKTAVVYRTGAALTHTADAMLRSGDNELVVEGLSSAVDINSIQVNCPASVTILGTEFSNNFLTPENLSPAVLKLKDSVADINLNIQKINILINVSNQLLDVLNSNREIKGTQTGMSVAELVKLMDYYKLKSTEIQTQLADYQLRKAKMENLVAKLNNQVNEEQLRNTTSGGRLTLQLNAAMAGDAELSVSYITQNAYWIPYYDVRADNIKSPLKFIYKAKIAQTTGIDWKKVKLSLSTSAPKQFGNAPLLKTWFLGYINPVTMMNKDLNKPMGVELETVTVGAFGLKTQARDANSVVHGLRSPAGADLLYVVNGTVVSKADFSKINPSAIKKVDVLNGGQSSVIYGSEAANGAVVVTLKDGLQDYITVTDNELDLTYDIALPYDVPANGKQQVATLQETTVPATYRYYSAPRIDKEAFLLAEVADWQTLNLLPGEANIIFEGTYIGKSFIDPANTNDTLSLTLGTDKRVAISKEKIKDYSSIKFIGSNKLQTITYDITVKNNKKEPISIILNDQYPISTLKEIEVSLIESSEAKINTETGLLSWQLKIEPGQNKKMRVTYSVKYPKDKVVNLN